MGQNYVSHLGIYRRALLVEIGGFREGYEGSQDYDLALRCSEKLQPAQIRHIPRVLYHWRMVEGSAAATSEAKPYAPKAARLAIADHLQRKNIDGAVVPCPENREWHRVIYHLRSPLPLVSIIIPTRDQAALLQRCLTSIREKTDYAPIEIVIVDNGSTKPETHAFLHDLALDPRIQIVTDGAEFNFSRLINRGVRIARGEILAFLNDDIETDKSDWLREMVSRAIRPEVGRGRRALVVSRWKIAACRRGARTPRSGASRIPTFSAATSRADESDLHLVTKLFRGYGCMHGATKNGLR